MMRLTAEDILSTFNTLTLNVNFITDSTEHLSTSLISFFFINFSSSTLQKTITDKHFL